MQLREYFYTPSKCSYESLHREFARLLLIVYQLMLQLQDPFFNEVINKVRTDIYIFVILPHTQWSPNKIVRRLMWRLN